MDLQKRQGELFINSDLSVESYINKNEIFLKKDLLQKWQERIYAFQALLFKGNNEIYRQGDLFKEISNAPIHHLNPLSLTALPINFWRWPKSPHKGAAIYLVMDYLEHQKSHILLYVGETNSAAQRWKGEHDCKNYLEEYSEALNKVGIPSQLSIRFWTDVPKETLQRRKLEQELIQKWLPPFNKETRSRWESPFTTSIKPFR